MRLFFIALVSFCLTCTAARAGGDGPTVLLLTDSRGYTHDVVKPTDGQSVVRKTIQSVVEDRLGGRLVHTGDAATISAEMLDPARTHAIVMYTTGELPLDLEALNRYVEGGGALMGIHCATDTFHKDAGYYGLMGATFLEHPWNADTEVTLKSLEPQHPAVAEIGASRTLKEEIYRFTNFDPEKVRVLMVLDMEKTALKRPEVVPIVWVKQRGQGRVLYTSLGHNEAVWKSDWYQQHLAGSLKWLMGEVEGASEPNPEVTKKEDELAKQAAGGARNTGADGVASRAAVAATIPGRGLIGLAALATNRGWLAQDGAEDAGFTVLFDGTAESASANWRGFKKDSLPDGWAVEDGAITLRQAGAGDLITREKYADFDFRFEWKIEPGGNSGVMYRVSEEGEGTDATYLTGPEYQILDDEKGADNKTTLTRAGALYGLYPAPDDSPVKPAGEWNQARIVLRGNHIEHWLNGEKIVEAEMGSEDWNQRLASSKFARWGRFAREREGHIALQDHGDEVAYRNMRIQRLEVGKSPRQAEAPAEDGMN